MDANIEILLAEDNQDEIILIEEALSETNLRINLNTVRNGVQVMKYLRKEGAYELAKTPDILILDLNMPRKNGAEVLVEIKADINLKSIPVFILSTSGSEVDIKQAYDNKAHCFITKPSDFHEFKTLIKSIEGMWFENAKHLDNRSDIFIFNTEFNSVQ